MSAEDVPFAVEQAIREVSSTVRMDRTLSQAQWVKIAATLQREALSIEDTVKNRAEQLMPSVIAAAVEGTPPAGIVWKAFYLAELFLQEHQKRKAAISAINFQGEPVRRMLEDAVRNQPPAVK